MATDSVTVSPTINGDAVSLTAGMIVRLKPGANNNVVRAQADSAPHAQGVNGVVISGACAPGTSCLVACIGRQPVQMESGLVPSVGDTVYVSPNVPGKGTNVQPGVVAVVGTIADTANYVRLGVVAVDVAVGEQGTAGAQGPQGAQGSTGAGAAVSATGITLGATPLNGINAAGLVDGTLAAVQLNAGAASFVGAFFTLTDNSSLTVDNLTVVTASGRAGAQWLRLNLYNKEWEAQTTWAIDTSAGSDEAAGGTLAPLKTAQELARRLASATLTAAVTCTVTGNMAAGDKAVFTFVCSGGSFTFVGTPVLIYTSTTTGVATASAAPTTTENNIVDAAVPGGSFTAAGAMAAGVLFQRTAGGTACAWFAAKDEGATTARISKPQTLVSGQTLNIGDTYIVSQLPTITMPRFPANALQGETVTIKNWYGPSGSGVNAIAEQCFIFYQCWFAAARVPSGNALSCCCLTTNSNVIGAAASFSALGIVLGGLCLGTGSSTFLIKACSLFQINSVPLTLQGTQLIIAEGSAEQSTDILAYDCTTFPLQVIQNGVLTVVLGGFGGANNTELANATRGSRIAHVPNPYWVAGSSTDAATPIVPNGTAGMTVAAESGGGGALNAQFNGIFPTT